MVIGLRFVGIEPQRLHPSVDSAPVFELPDAAWGALLIRRSVELVP
jgi:hypothetical protein